MTATFEKRQKIKESLKKTKEKRKKQIAKVYQLKILSPNVSKKQVEIKTPQCREKRETTCLLDEGCHKAYIRVSGE